MKGKLLSDTCLCQKKPKRHGPTLLSNPSGFIATPVGWGANKRHAVVCVMYPLQTEQARLPMSHVTHTHMNKSFPT